MQIYKQNFRYPKKSRGNGNHFGCLAVIIYITTVRMLYTTTEFETIYIRHFPLSMKLAMSLLHDEEEARDVVQDVYDNISKE